MCFCLSNKDFKFVFITLLCRENLFVYKDLCTFQIGTQAKRVAVGVRINCEGSRKLTLVFLIVEWGWI